jgi:V/A-type H+-transporting ATPase subunit K
MKATTAAKKVARAKLAAFMLLFAAAITLSFILAVHPHMILAQQEKVVPEQPVQAPTPARGVGFLAAAISSGLSVLAAGYAVAKTGVAAMGAVAEKPELIGRSLIYVGLAEGLAIYGLIVAIIILGKV